MPSQASSTNVAPIWSSWALNVVSAWRERALRRAIHRMVRASPSGAVATECRPVWSFERRLDRRDWTTLHQGGLQPLRSRQERCQLHRGAPDTGDGRGRARLPSHPLRPKSEDDGPQVTVWGLAPTGTVGSHLGWGGFGRRRDSGREPSMNWMMSSGLRMLPSPTSQRIGRVARAGARPRRRRASRRRRRGSCPARPGRSTRGRGPAPSRRRPSWPARFVPDPARRHISR